MRLIVNYETTHPDASAYGLQGQSRKDPRTFRPAKDEVLTCLVYMPRLELQFIEETEIYCQFKGGNFEFGQFLNNGQPKSIGPNRVVLHLDTTSYSLERFLLHGKVRIIL